MRAWFSPCLGFAALLILQLGFFSFLPWFFPSIPLVFAYAVYRAHTFRVEAGVAFLILYGGLLDYTDLSGFDQETVAYAAAGLALALACQRMFATRSYYGALGSATLAFATLTAARALFLFGPWVRNPFRADWGLFGKEAFSELLLLLILLSLFYVVRPLSGSVRRSVRTS